MKEYFDLYHIICLKRSKFADSTNFEYMSEWWKACHLVYWLPGRRGYTFFEYEAGMYTLEDIKDCAGEGLDWMIMRIPRCDA